MKKVDPSIGWLALVSATVDKQTIHCLDICYYEFQPERMFFVDVFDAQIEENLDLKISKKKSLFF